MICDGISFPLLSTNLTLSDEANSPKEKGTPIVIGAPSILFLTFILKVFDADKLYEMLKNKRK